MDPDVIGKRAKQTLKASSIREAPVDLEPSQPLPTDRCLTVSPH